MLSRLMLVSDRRAMTPHFLTALQSALEGGARFFQLREKDLPADKLRILARETAILCARFNATLVVNSAPKSALEIARENVCGAHFPERELANIEYSISEFYSAALSPAAMSVSASAPSVSASCGASVHSVEAARKAEKLGANYLVFGAVFPTTSHPGETPAGIEKLREVTQAVAIPVYAIGGIDNEYSIGACLENGAFGVAIRSAVWNARDVQRKVEEFLKIIENLKS